MHGFLILICFCQIQPGTLRGLRKTFSSFTASNKYICAELYSVCAFAWFSHLMPVVAPGGMGVLAWGESLITLVKPK